MGSRSGGGGDNSNASPYASILEKLRLPQSQLQRHAVVSLFHKLQLKLLSDDPNSSPHAIDAVSQCLRSTSPAVVDQAVRELCRIFKTGLVSPKIVLVELHSALEGSDPRFVGLFVKAIGFVCRVGFGSDRNWGREGFDSLELHPFVKVLSCGEEVEAELMQQVLLFVVHNRTVGMEYVTRFLRPFFMYAVIRNTMFARNLILAVSSLSCSFQSEAISIIKLLTESLKFFSCTNEREFKHLIDSAEYVVDAFVVVLKQMVHTEMQLSRTVQDCGMDIVDTLFSLCIFMHRPHGAVEFVVELSKRLLIAQKEAGLHYLPEISMVVVSISIILTQVEFEHEHLSILRLLIFLFEWRTENELNAKGSACYLCEELLYILPVISLLSSPSKSVKTAAAFLLSAVERLLSDLYVSIKSVASEDEFLLMNKPEYIPFRLLRCLWFQEKSHYPQSTYLGLTCSIFSNVDETYSRPAYWTCQLRSYLLAVETLKDTPVSQSSSDVVAGTHLLLGSIASILVMHPFLGSSAVDCLAAIGLVDPKLGMPLLQALLFHSKMLCSYRGNSTEMLLRLLEMLPSLASYSVMVPLIVQTILPMLQKNASPVLYAVAIRLLCKTWIVTDRAFGTLQEFLDPEALSDFISERQICISIASSLRDVCRHNPDRGVDLILSVSSCIESRDSTVQALGFESLAYLCEADVVDFYTAWVVVAKHLMDYSIDPIVAHGLCTLLSHGAMDASAYPETSKKLIHILWSVATSRNSCSAPLWVKARVSAFKSLSHYEVEHVMDEFPDFRETNLRCLVTEDNIIVLMAMEEFEAKIINFEHINRRRVVKQKRTMVHKVEKLLDVFPKVIFSQGNHKFSPSELPGAALLSLAFTPNDIQGTSKDMAKLHSAYEKALMEISESLLVSRNALFAVLALQSWKGFMHQWIRAAGMHINSKGSSSTSDGISRAANDILKILFKVAAKAVPRVAVNIALATGALCTVVPSTAHAVISSATNFLLKWLVEHEHEHQQWSAAISLGLVCNCLHATDRMQKSKVITELLKAVSNSKSYLVKGACGVGLGFACQDLLTMTAMENPNPEGNFARISEIALLRNIVRTLSSILSQFCPSASVSLKSLSENFLLGGVDTFNEDLLDLPNEDYTYSEEDAWGIAGLVLGLGNSVVAVYRAGAYDDVLKIKEILYSWVPQVDSSVQGSIFCREMTEVPLSIGSCLVLPTVMAFCQRTELIHNDSDLLYRYGSLISSLLCSKKSGVLYQNLMMASCVGAGSFLSCILSDGLNSLRLEDVKYLLELLRDTYTHSYPPPVHLGGMLGVVNAFGAGAGYLTHLYHQATPFQFGSEQESLCNQDSSFITGSLFSSPSCNSLSTSVVQELFLMAKESMDQQTKQYAAWALSFLREKCLSNELQNNDSESGATDSSVPSQNFADDSLVLKLCLWLRDIDVNKSENVIHATTVSTALRCLSKAPRLPALDWGAAIRRCMRFGAKFPAHSGKSSDLLREECICFALAHANDINSLMFFLDELTELSRFRTLELNLQCTLLYHLSDLLKLFSGSKLEKLSENLVAYFSSSVGPYMSYDLDQRTLLRVSFWKGLHQCLDETLKESMYPQIEKCMECLFIILPVLTCDSGSDAWKASGIEWSVALKCLSKAPRGWLMDLLQVPNIDCFHGRSDDEVAKRISTRASLVRTGCIPISELDLIKALVLNTRHEGCWWNVLMDVAAAVSSTEGNTKTKWLLDALEISCIAVYPSTALRFVGLLSGSCCRYMPLLVVDPDTVLSDLPVTLPSILSDSRWNPIAESASNRLWASTERVCSWASRLAGNENGQSSSQDGIDNAEAPKAFFLARVLHRTCVSLKGYLPLQKQLMLANLEVSYLY